MKELYTSVTRKGQITLPAEIRRLLKIKEGDRIAVSLVAPTEGEEPQAVIKPVRSVAEMTFGAVPPLKRPKDAGEIRAAFEEGMAQRDGQVMSGGRSEADSTR
jgi:AbrB family looped-hinge helix DNA binding protein